MRKRHNHSAVIDPLIMENMIASGENLGTIALRLGCDRTTLYKRSQRDPELRAAVKCGKEKTPRTEGSNSLSAGHGRQTGVVVVGARSGGSRDERKAGSVMGDTKIQWTNKTWNPIRARNKANDERGWYCEHVSDGCRNCYAEKMNVNTYFGNGLPYKASSLPQLDLFLDERILKEPLHWRTPQNVFPCSMTDMFARFVPDEWLDRIFAVMALATNHTFQILTKRPDRMRDYTQSVAASEGAANRIRKAINQIPSGLGDRRGALELPLFNVWLGTSVEDQKTADERIPLLLETLAAVRWISAEPLLGPVKLSQNWVDYLAGWAVQPVHVCGNGGEEACYRLCPEAEQYQTHKLDWVVAGGESGPEARPCALEWIEGIVKQCQVASVPVFVKQLGAFVVSEMRTAPADMMSEPSKLQPHHYAPSGEVWAWRAGLQNKKGGDIAEFPEELRVREFPQTKAVAA